jgi:5-(carboxyamino)imidazole ribonucleotide synthase
MLPSKKTIGIIGGGQLGKMLIEAGQPWNIQYNILDVADCPSTHLAKNHIVGTLMDAEKIKELANISDVITYEIEHINLEALKQIEADGKTVIPSSRILEIIQDKGLQKTFFGENNIPTTNFVLVDNVSQWKDALPKLNGEKIAAKSRKGGYDGKGVDLITKSIILSDPNNIPFQEASVLEEFVVNSIELSVIVARNEKNESICFPTVEMEFDPVANLVEFLFAPANISPEIEEKAKNIALDCIQKLNGIGLFAVEMFLDADNNIFINEIAPRPHNSGHHTIEACYTSQYEQLNRILLNLPLGSTDLIQHAAMINLLGAQNVAGPYELSGLNEILNLEGVFIHLYNKKDTKPKRKMGHITITANNMEDVRRKAEIVKKHMGMKQL